MRKCYSLSLRCCFVSACLALSACGSDSKKYERLTQDQAIACLGEQKYQDDYLVAKKAKNPHADTLGKLWIERRTECELATRDLNRFMR